MLPACYREAAVGQALGRFEPFALLRCDELIEHRRSVCFSLRLPESVQRLLGSRLKFLRQSLERWHWSL
jgi:hypothetical protein